jgi:uncharacterized protein (DUF1697 family)
VPPSSPTRYVALLRAINVPGHAIIRMSQLCTAFEAAGCRKVISYSSAGNVIFETSVSESDALFKKIKARVRALAGGEPSIVFRTMSELDAAVRAAPFGTLVDDKTVKLYVVFLAERAKRKPALPMVDEKERLELIGVHGAHAYVVSRRKPNALMYGFPNSFVENALGVAATSRNWSTVSKILARSRELGTAAPKNRTRPTNVSKR